MTLSEKNKIFLKRSIQYIKKLDLINRNNSQFSIRLSKTGKWMNVKNEIFVKYIIVNSKYATNMNTHELNTLWGTCFQCFDVVQKFIIDYVNYTISSAGDYDYVDYSEYMELLNKRRQLKTDHENELLDGDYHKVIIKSSAYSSDDEWDLV
jgi:hypothetical protein